MNKYRVVQIPDKAKVFHFDLTTRCNLQCPMCPRVIAKLHVKSDFDLNLLEKIPIEEAETLLFCGRTGDPSLYPHLFELIRRCKERSPYIKINISTNGAAQNISWWKELSKVLNDIEHSVIFCIDGLKDTLPIYRVGASYDKVISNATAFINNGGKAVWKYVTFKHNEHQMEEAEQLSIKMGFKEFIPIFSYHYGEGFEKPPKYNDLETKYERCDNEKTYIHCRMEKLGEFFITYDGYVLPCCHINPARESGFFNNIKKLNLSDMSFEDMRNNNYFKRIAVKILFYPLCNNFCRTRIDRWANTRIK